MTRKFAVLVALDILSAACIWLAWLVAQGFRAAL